MVSNIDIHYTYLRGSENKESACTGGDPRLNPQVGKIPWRREWLPTAILLLREFHEQKSPAGYGPWGRKELNN